MINPIYNLCAIIKKWDEWGIQPAIIQNCDGNLIKISWVYDQQYAMREA